MNMNIPDVLTERHTNVLSAASVASSFGSQGREMWKKECQKMEAHE